MLKPRPLYCPNVVLLVSGKESIFPIEEAKSIIEKLSNDTKLIVVYITHAIEDLNDLQIVIKSIDYSIFQEKRSNNARITSEFLNSGAKHVYYIKTDINMYRNAFVHFYDILSSDYPIICISNFLATQLQAAAIIIPDSLDEKEKLDLQELILQPNKIFSTSEILMQEHDFFAKTKL